MQINMLFDLLSIDINQLSLSNKTSTFDQATNTTTITGTTTVLGLPNQTVRASFVNGQLVNPPQVTLTSISLQQLAGLNVLPPRSSYQDNDLPAIVFASIEITPEPGTGQLIFSGVGPAGNLPLGIAALPIADTALYVKLSFAADSQTTISQDAYLSGTLQLGQGVAVHLHLPRGYMDWRLESVNSQPSALVNGLSDLTALSGHAITPLLPVNMPGVSHFGLGGLTVQFNTITSIIAGVQLTISSTDTWTVISDVLVITNFTVSLSFARWDNWQGPDWQISGTINGIVELFDIPCQISIPVPPGAEEWTLTVRPNVTIPGLGDLVNNLSKLIGTGDLSPSLPSGLDTLGALTVEFLEIVINPSGTSAADILRSVAIRLINDSGWALPYATSLQLTDIFIDLNIVSPLGDDTQRLVTGTLGGLVYFDEFYIPLLFHRLTAASNWTMTIAYTDIEVTLPDLVSLAGLDGKAFQQTLPPHLSIIRDLALTNLSVNYDLTANALRDVNCAIELTDTWPILVDYLEVTDLGLSVEYYPLADSTAWEYFVFISAAVEIAGVEFFVSAGNIGAAGDWILTGELGKGQTINLNDLINWLMQRLLVTDFKLPAEIPVITVTDMSLRLNPATVAFKGTLTSTLTWSIPFCNTIFQIPNLTTTIDIGEIPRPPATGPRPYTFTASGKFQLTTFASFQAVATFSTSGGNSQGGTAPTILTIDVAASNVHLPDLINAILSPNADGFNTIKAWDTTFSPDGFIKPGILVQAGLQLDLTHNILLAHGTFSLPASDPRHDLYGAVALLVIPDAQNGVSSNRYALAASLNNWTFGKLLPALSVIDEILTVSEAAILFKSTDAAQDLTALTVYVPFIDAINNGIIFKYEPGVDFYATLHLSTGFLWSVAKFLGMTTPATFKLRGFISSGQVAYFQAELVDTTFTLLDALSFKNVSLSYTVSQAQTITLLGTLTLTMNQTAYLFVDGDLSVTRTTTNQITTTEASAHMAGSFQIANPLGIPKLELASVYFDLYYIFDGIKSDTQYMLSGIVRFSDLVSMTGFIYFKSHNPAVVLVQLENLDIGVFFQKLIGVTWDWFVFRLKNGMLHYVPKDVSLLVYDRLQKTTSNVYFSQGFHAAADIDIFFIKDFHIDIAINDNGMIATGGYLTPIDWGFIQVYRGPSENPHLPSDPSKGPVVSIHTVRSIFTLSGGFGLFGTPIASLLMSVKPGGIEGLIALDQDVSIFGKPSFNFTWDDENGFEVTNWQLGSIQLPNLIFVAEDFLNSTPDGVCALAGIIQLPIKSKVDIKPDFSIKLLVAEGQTFPTPHLTITLNGSLDLVLNSSVYPDVLLNVPIADATLAIPFPGTGGFTWDALAASFVDCLKGAAYSIFETLITDPRNLAKLLAVEGLVWAADEVKDFLVCEGVEDAAAASFADGAAGVVATSLAVSILGVSGIVVGGVVSSLDSNGHRVNSGSDDDSGHDTHSPRPNAPAAPTLSYTNGQLSISWLPVANASLYSVIVTQDDQYFAQTNASSELFAKVAVNSGHHYSVRVVATGEGGTSAAGDAAFLDVAPDAPTGVTITYPGTSAQVSWQAVQGATSYVVELRDSSNELAHSADTPIGGNPPTTLQVWLPSRPGAYTCRVKATTNGISSAWSAPLAVTVLPALQIVKLNYADNSILVEWSALADAVRYVLMVQREDGVNVASANLIGNAAHPPATRKNFPLSSIMPKGLVYTLFLAGTTAANSVTVMQFSRVLTLDKVKIQSVDVQPNLLTISWQGVEGATGYEIRLVEMSPLQIPNVPASGDWNRVYTSEISLINLYPGKYTIQVRAIGGIAASLGFLTAEWSEGFSFNYVARS